MLYSFHRASYLLCVLLLVHCTLQVSAEPWWKRQTNGDGQTNGGQNNGGGNQNSTNGGQNNGGGNNTQGGGNQTQGGGNQTQPTGNSTATPTLTNSTTPTSSAPARTSPVDPRNGPAALEMTTPALTQNKALYKIGGNVTFGWKWINQPVIKPQVLNIRAQAATSKTWYIIATNITANSTSYDWVTAEQTNPPLVMSDYTLYIFDERGKDAPQQAGRMQPFSGLIFSMYLPEQYTPLDGYTCATCISDGSFPYVPILMTFAVMVMTVFTFGFFMI